jgi:hypothetical protein
MQVQTVATGGHGEDLPCLGPVPANEIHAAARKEGISMATLLAGNLMSSRHGVSIGSAGRSPTWRRSWSI